MSVLLQSVFIIIARYLAKPLTLGCGTLHEKLWLIYCNLSPDVSLQMHLGKSSLIGEVRARRGHEDAEGEYRYSYTLSITSALEGDGYSRSLPGRFTPGKETRCRCVGVEGALEPVREGVENLVPTGIRYPDRSAGSKSLYRLLYKNSLITYSIGMF
jgi:hypothetical protein